jgi:hypothetical protein
MVWGNPPSTFSALKIFFIFFEPFHQPFPRVSLEPKQCLANAIISCRLGQIL